MQLKKREAETLFGKLQLDVESSHHKTATFYYNGRAILRTRVSHGRGDIPAIVVAKMRSQLKVTEGQMRQLVDCSMNLEDYVALLKAKGLINWKSIKSHIFQPTVKVSIKPNAPMRAMIRLLYKLFQSAKSL